MQRPLLPQVLKLEQAFEETVKSGTQLQDSLRTAVLLCCIQCQLKTHLNLSLTDGCSYADVRETGAQVGQGTSQMDVMVG